MSILKVARMGHPVLRKTTKPVPQSEIAGVAIQRLIDDMIETMIEYNGVGLAAPQVREDLRIFVARVDADNEEDEEGAERAERRPASTSDVIVIINPEITPVGRRMVEDWEGCLSIPDLRGRVQRHRDIKMRAFNREGQRLEIEATGYVARVMQHEADHLDGVLFLDRMKTLQSLSFIEEYVRYHSKQE
ncbi:MAG: peptide deformylase [Acidobacteria bacterium]|nr:peptide deformylase [Acidobacteriota bacterium]